MPRDSYSEPSWNRRRKTKVIGDFWSFSSSNLLGVEAFQEQDERGAVRKHTNFSAAVNSVWILKDSLQLGLCFDWQKKNLRHNFFFFHS